MLTGGMGYEAIGRVSDARRLPLRGQMADIGGYRLNINCTGVGTPTVIPDSGPGEPALSWTDVQSGVERFSPVSSYDRAAIDTVILVCVSACRCELAARCQQWA